MANERDLLVTLEELVDEWGLQTVLQGIADVCMTKAIHIEDNWAGTGSEGIVREWRGNGHRVQQAANRAKMSADRVREQRIRTE